MQKFKHELNKNFKNDKIQQHFKTLKEHLQRRCYLNEEFDIRCSKKKKKSEKKNQIWHVTLEWKVLKKKKYHCRAWFAEAHPWSAQAVEGCAQLAENTYHALLAHTLDQHSIAEDVGLKKKKQKNLVETWLAKGC